MIQSFGDEYETLDRKRATPAAPGSILIKVEKESDVVGKKRHTYYRSGVGKLLHMSRWSRSEIQNAVRECARQGSASTEAHVKAMHNVMEYVKSTPNRGWRLKPKRKWDGTDRNFKFKIEGKADSDYAKCPVKRRSVSGNGTFLEGAPVLVRSSMQKFVALSVTEAEAVSAVSFAQDMLYTMRVIESIGLKVEKLMILEVDKIVERSIWQIIGVREVELGIW